MYLVTNKVDLFPTTKQEKEGILVFETDSFSGQTTLFLLDKEKIRNICYVEGNDTKEPMPLFADIIYSLLKRTYEGLSLNCEPDRNKILIFNPSNGVSQVEITYQKENNEYRVLFTPDMESVAKDVCETLRGLELRVVSFVFSYLETEEKEEEEEKESEGGVLDSVMSELDEKTEDEVEDSPKSEEEGENVSE